jgi:paired amphipathic helix protein Sin3a
MGTTIQHITGRGGQSEGGGHSQPTTGAQPFFAQRGNPWQQQPLHNMDSASPEATFSTPAQNGQGSFNPAQGPSASFDGPGSGHQQGRGVSQISNGGPPNAPPRNTHTPTPSVAQAVNGNAAQQANMERRGPVEFNHAISYVNKIKVRIRVHCHAVFVAGEQWTAIVGVWVKELRNREQRRLKSELIY